MRRHDTANQRTYLVVQEQFRKEAEVLRMGGAQSFVALQIYDLRHKTATHLTVHLVFAAINLKH